MRCVVCLTMAGASGESGEAEAEDQVEEFIRKVKEGYEPYRTLEGEKLREAIFATKPSAGAFGECCFFVGGGSLRLNIGVLIRP